MIVNKSMFPLQTGFSAISNMQGRMSELQQQLGTGQKSSTLAGMGSDLSMSLSVRSRLSRIEGFNANIGMIDLRLGFLDNAMTRFDKIEGEARTSIRPGDYGTNDINMSTQPDLARARFDEVVTMLNQDVAGRYLFGGNVTDKQPLEDPKVLLDGEGGRDGYKKILENRIAADLGSTTPPTLELGRLQLPAVAAGTGTATLVEDGAHPFGFKISTISTTAAGSISVDRNIAADPADLSVTFTGEPTPGQSVTIGLTLPDGTETQLTLTASENADPALGQFAIDADPDVMAANFRTALEAKVADLAQSELKAASTFAAAQNFFSATGVPQVTTGGPPATGLVDGDPNEVVFWYKGQISDNPRAGVSAKIDESTSVKYGIEATESGLLRMVQSLAAMAVTTYPAATDIRATPSLGSQRLAAMGQPEGAARDTALAAYEAEVTLQYRQSRGLFDGMASRQQSQMSESRNSDPGSVERITMDLGIARSTANATAERHKNYTAQLENLLSDVETVSNEEVAVEILALQTRLQASFQVTSMVSQLSLVNYI